MNSHPPLPSPLLQAHLKAAKAELKRQQKHIKTFHLLALMGKDSMSTYANGPRMPANGSGPDRGPANITINNTTAGGASSAHPGAYTQPQPGAYSQPGAYAPHVTVGGGGAPPPMSVHVTTAAAPGTVLAMVDGEEYDLSKLIAVR